MMRPHRMQLILSTRVILDRTQAPAQRETLRDQLWEVRDFPKTSAGRRTCLDPISVTYVTQDARDRAFNGIEAPEGCFRSPTKGRPKCC